MSDEIIDLTSGGGGGVDSTALHSGDNISGLVNDAGYLTEHQSLSDKQDVISDLETIRSGAAAGATAVQPADLPDMPSVSPLFSVNSGNLNSSNEGDLVGTASYDLTPYNYFSATNANKYTLSGTIATVGTDKVGFYPNYSGNFPDELKHSGNPFKFITKVTYPNASGGIFFDMGFTSTPISTNTPRTGWHMQNAGSGNTYSVYGKFLLNNSDLSSNTRFDSYKSFNGWLMYEFTGTEYNFKSSTDKINWTTVGTAASTTASDVSTFVFMYSNMIVDLAETYYEINGTVVWKAIDAVNMINNVSFKVGGDYPSIVATNGQGTQFTVDELANQTLSGYADGTYNIFLTPEGTTYALANTVYIQKSTPSMNSGDVWFNTSKYPYEVTKYGTEGDFEDIPICQITIATQANSSKLITASKTYPYNRLTVQAVELSDVAYSGSYNDLTNKPTIPDLTSYSGYDATETQVLKNVEGVLTWVTETTGTE